MATVRTESGHRMVEGKELARFVREQDEEHTPEELASRSARNRFSGVVTRVERDKLTAIIELRAGRFRVVSLLTREAADALKLEEGDLATAVVKSTSVMVEVSPA
jgi:molybdopterin-binding protein